MIWVTIVCTVMGGVIGAAATYYFGVWGKRLRHLGYTITSSDSLLPSAVTGVTYTLSLNGHDVENISTVHIELYNKTDLDYEDVPVILTFLFHERTGQGPIEPISHRCHRVGIEPVYRTPFTEFAYDAATHIMKQKCGTRIPIVNRSDKPCFVGDWTFPLGKAPDVTVEVLKKGVDSMPLVVGASRVYSLDVINHLIGVIIACAVSVAIGWEIIHRK